jgi:hypothetical protein
MVFNDIEKFHSRKRHDRQRKLNLIQDQVIKCFFTAHPTNEIKAKIKEAIEANKNYLPTFSLRYKLRSSLEESNETNYIELLSDEYGTYMLVDFDFHNMDREMLESTYHKQYKKQLKSDFDFNIDGRTEDGSLTIRFCKIYKPFLSDLF